MLDKSPSLLSDAAALHYEHTWCCRDAGKRGASSLSCLLCVSLRQPLLCSLRGKVHPQPAQQRPVHPGPHVQFPAALRQQ